MKSDYILSSFVNPKINFWNGHTGFRAIFVLDYIIWHLLGKLTVIIISEKYLFYVYIRNNIKCYEYYHKCIKFNWNINNQETCSKLHWTLNSSSQPISSWCCKKLNLQMLTKTIIKVKPNPNEFFKDCCKLM